MNQKQRNSIRKQLEDLDTEFPRGMSDWELSNFAVDNGVAEWR